MPINQEIQSPVLQAFSMDRGHAPFNGRHFLTLAAATRDGGLGAEALGSIQRHLLPHATADFGNQRIFRCWVPRTGNPGISLVFREMWDTTALDTPFFVRFAPCVSERRSQLKVFIFNADTDMERILLCGGAFAWMLHQPG